VVGSDDSKAFAAKERDPPEQLGADYRMLLDEEQFVPRQRARLVHDPIRQPDLADVMEEKAVLEGRSSRSAASTASVSASA
jgi:hypothetical protein